MIDWDVAGGISSFNPPLFIFRMLFFFFSKSNEVDGGYHMEEEALVRAV